MTSQVNPNNIDGTYPVAGQDNDSQGFRDNFTNVRNNFTYIKAEVEDLQNKAVLKSALTNTTLDNNLSGNAVVGASLTQWRENFNDIGAVSGSITVDFTNGNFQKITMNGSTTLAFSFPSNTSGQYASVKLWVHVETTAYTLTLPSSVTLGDPDTIAGLAGTSPPIITFNSAQLANATDFFFEFYTVNSGTTLGIKDLTRNRDVDLSGLNISGNLTLDNLTSSGNIVTTNGIYWAGNGNPFSIAGGGSGAFSTVTASSTIIGSGNIVAAATTTSTSTTTGALVVVGGTGIGGNVNIDSNLWVNSGNIRSTSTRANIFNVTVTTISLGNVASFISMGATGSNVLLNGGLTVVGNITTSANLITPYITSAIGSGADIIIEPDGAGDIILGAGTGSSNVVINSSTTSVSSTTGALVVTGGAGIGGEVRVGSSTTSTGTTSGALVVTGGAGIGGNLNLGGNLTINAFATVTLGGGSPTNAPLTFTSGSGLTTTPIRGAFEFEPVANIFYATPTVSTTSGRAIIPVRHEFVLGANVNINGGGTIAVINTAYGAFGNLNVRVAGLTTYEVDARIHVGFAAAPTSSTLQFTFGGTATAAGYNYDVTVINAAAGSISTASSMSNWYGFGTFPTATAGVVSAAQTLPNVLLRVRGIIRTNAEGTLIPQLAWGTLPAQTAQCVQQSYIVLTPLGTNSGNVSVGNFTLV